MTAPYYSDDSVTLYHGDCRELTDWLTADVLVTDPPYGIGWRTNGGGGNGITPGRHHDGIHGDHDTSARDEALNLWGAKPALVFGSFRALPPGDVIETLIYRKPADSGVLGTATGWRRDVEPVYVLGSWPCRKARWSAVIAARGGICNAVKRTGHPHTKPLDVMEQLVAACPAGVVADPFAGSGSTLVAARNLGRRAVGVELDERYCEVIIRRLAQDVLPIGGSA